jgi:hypothetical protein
MIIKSLTQSGNSKAILLDSAILKAAGLGDDALFCIVINPNGGITIQSIESTHAEMKKAAFRKAMKENYQLLKRLADK